LGSQDNIVSTESSIRLAETIPGAKIEIIPRAGHLLFIERSEEFNELTLGFLEYLRENASKLTKRASGKPGILKKLTPFQ